MDIVIVANFCGSMQKTDNDRFLYLAGLLANEHQVEVVTSDYDHDRKIHRKTIADFPFQITQLHESGYDRNVCLKRFASHYGWGRRVKEYLRQRKKPDVVYCAVPSLTGPLAAAEYCRREKVRLVIDVQDLWPEAFTMVFHVPVVSDVVFAPFRRMANGIYRTADAVCAVSETYVKRALSVNEKQAPGRCVFLGTRLEDFDRNAGCRIQTEDRGDNQLLMGYCGTLGSSYDLTCVFDALALLKEKGVTPPRFLVMGDGPRKSEFEQYAEKKGVDTLFTGRLPYDEMCARLSRCDLVVNPISPGAAQSIINKHADYAAAGRPVLNTQECPEYRNLVDAYKMGFNCRCGDPQDLAEKLAILIGDETLRREMGENARRCAIERFDREHSYQALIDAITDS